MTTNLVTGNGRPVDYAGPRHRQQAQEDLGFSLHPEVQRATYEFSEAVRERDLLREENAALKNQVKLFEANIAELQHTIDHERVQKEKFQRYCVTVQTLIRSIAVAAEQANAAATDHAVREEPKAVPSVSTIEKEVAALAKSLGNETRAG
jgi:hypothetical protein